LKLKIGIFDSGIGGFTVLNSLLMKNKEVEVIYLADIARNPYGDKNVKEIRIIAGQICNWFKDKNLDALLIACNTTNSCALDILKNELNIPCFDLINSVSEVISSNKVGILATSATIKSSFYKEIIESKYRDIKVFQQSCPGFVNEIEKMQLDFEKISHLSEVYLEPLLSMKVKEIILGCSHYPLIYDILRQRIPSEIKIIDPSIALINKFNKYFYNAEKYCYEKPSYNNVNFFVTGKIKEFTNKVSNWLEINKKISLVNLRTDT
tara:strand:+ start:19011 stop:19805 length:795 start_codon:yes stop_codon:yes gene_type:complete